MKAATTQTIQLENVSKFYGEVLGVNRVDLDIEPGITSIVGPNGSGKTTLMNLLAGLIRPTQGRLRILGLEPSQPEDLFRLVGYCTQFDSFPRGMTGRQFISSFLSLHGYAPADVKRMTEESLERVGMTEAANRRIAGYSKGMRQRIKLGQALAHDPQVLVLDEPLNGLDPMARAEIIGLFREQAERGLHVLISSHILHEVDMISDRVILISHGYIVAEGEIQGVREEVQERPMQIMVRCSEPRRLARAILARDSVTEIQLHKDGAGIHLRTRDSSGFFDRLAELVVEEGLELESMGPADDNMQAVYRYLVADDSSGSGDIEFSDDSMADRADSGDGGDTLGEED